MSLPRRHYVTVAHAHQVAPLALSLARHGGPFDLHALAWDWTASGSSSAPGVTFANRETFLGRHPEMAPERLPGPPRSPAEQACTVRWTYAADVMEATGAPATVIDGDLWFWGDPEPVFEEIAAADRPLALTEHGFASADAGLPGITRETHLQYGRFNGGFVHFSDPAPARYLAELTRRWCYASFLDIGGRRLFGDQGYLELLDEKFGAHVIRYPGVNVGPWNVHTRSLRQTHDGAVFFGGRPLVAYHYSSLVLGERIAHREYAITDEQMEMIYRPYLAELEAHC